MENQYNLGKQSFLLLTAYIPQVKEHIPQSTVRQMGKRTLKKVLMPADLMHRITKAYKWAKIINDIGNNSGNKKMDFFVGNIVWSATE